MRLQLSPNKIDAFQASMKTLAPWYHSFWFREDILTGYYKHHGLGFDQTFVNNQSEKFQIERMRKAYQERDESVWESFIEEMLSALPIEDRSRATILDISSSTGKNSLYCIRQGFGKIISSEIRDNTSEQHRMILDALEDDQYREKTVIVNDTTSADDVAFPNRYDQNDIDVVLSFNLLYHLTNPYQHLVNLKRITRKYAIVYTKTHHIRNGYNTWNMTIENSHEPTQAMFDVGWTPHFLAVKELCERVGFKVLDVRYPEIFRRNFPHFVDSKYGTAERRMRLDHILNKTLGVKRGYCLNHHPEYFKPTYLDPRYFAYILELD